ncbi:hypothetical protein PRVXH_002053 [Proteinivorax hydrogeniformans]|uniref:Uncharacterized protein n=1 Tax=Proteinivorax hydrogeniformans TaxID=1826727 RepID=A0AAU8HRC6_9FIRM
MCLLIQQDINTLVLDEPTNHLDIDSIEMLEESLQEFRGTILFISHDRYFINKIAVQTIELNKRKLTKYLGNYDYYKEKRGQINQQQPKEEVSKKEEKKQIKSIKKTHSKKPNHHKINQLEAQIKTIETKIVQNNAKAQNHATNPKKLQEIMEENTKLESERDSLLKKWLQATNPHLT